MLPIYCEGKNLSLQFFSSLFKVIFQCNQRTWKNLQLNQNQTPYKPFTIQPRDNHASVLYVNDGNKHCLNTHAVKHMSCSNCF